MQVEYYKEYSPSMESDVEYKVYGHAGKVCVVFPPQNGRFYDFENFHMVDIASYWIEAGKLQLVCVDGIDGDTWSNEHGDGRTRIELHERWFHSVADEIVPRMMERRGIIGKCMTTGDSMGAVHAGNFFFRRPDLFDTVLGLSGVYNADFFFHGYMDDLVWANSPYHFVREMPEEDPRMAMYRQSRIIFCVGQGAWEDELRVGTGQIQQVMQERNIPAWVDYWGYDVNHDWCWWEKQFPYFLDKILD